ncbi:MAG: CARDB domain-containing protein [Vitreimonas sp.]
MTSRAAHLAFLAAAAFLSLAAAAEAQTQRQQPQTMQAQPQRPGALVARSPDLHPIPSRIEHGVIAVRNAGSAASVPSIVTVNCHQPGEEGGCADLPPRCEARYTDPAYPNVLVVNVPALAPGHVHNHNMACWRALTWPTGSYVFEFTADASNTNAESNEGNNTGSHVWNVP